MAGFPPKVKNTQKNIPDTDQTGATKDVYSKGSGGIAASLKIKNASVKPAAFPRRVSDPSNPDKTASVF